MNAPLESIICGIISNAITSLLARSYQLARQRTTLWNPPPTTKLRVGNALPGTRSLVLEQEGVVEFLQSQEAEIFCRHLCASILHRHKEHNAPATKSELSVYLGLYIKASISTRIDLTNYLYALMKSTIERGLRSTAISSELRASLRNSTRSELSAAAALARHLRSHAQSDLDRLKELEFRLRKQVSTVHGYITPPTFDTVVKLPLEKICIEPDIVHDRRQTLLTYEEFLHSMFRTVVLGNPGAGKTTFAKSLATRLAVTYPSRLVGNRVLTPIIVTTREYCVAKTQRGLSLAQYIEDAIRSQYQIRWDQALVEYALLSGRLLVIIDGLDELIDTGMRTLVTSDIDAFAAAYASSPMLVTSRAIGYDHAPLNSDAFDVHSIMPLSDEKVTIYVRKWFDLEPGMSQKARQLTASSFLAESSSISDLRSNPLMLGLLCSIYRGQSYLPKNRPDVYDKCANMLFERWDKSRGIRYELPFDAHVRPAMMYVASRVLEDRNAQSGITESSLVQLAKEYLLAHRFDRLVEAEYAAKSFIDYCKGRAWVFTDTGTTADGEALYQFTHRTFLEYFTGAHVARQAKSSEELASVLFAKVARSEWAVVAEIALQIHGRNVEGGADEVLIGLCIRSRDLPIVERTAILGFVGRSLSFIVPRPAVIRSACTIVFELLIECFCMEMRGDVIGATCNPISIVELFCRCSEENQGVVRQCLIEWSEECGRGDAGPATDVALSCAVLILRIAGVSKVPRDGASRSWLSVQGSMIEQLRRTVRKVMGTSIIGAAVGVMSGECEAKDVCNRLGVRALFRSILSGVFGADRGPSIVGIGLSAVGVGVEECNAIGMRSLESESLLCEIGALLALHSPPYVSGADISGSTITEVEKLVAVPLSEMAVFGMIVVLDVVMAAYRKRWGWEACESILRKAGVSEGVRAVLVNKWKGLNDRDVEATVSVPLRVQGVLDAWRAGRCEFVTNESAY